MQVRSDSKMAALKACSGHPEETGHCFLEYSLHLCNIVQAHQTVMVDHGGILPFLCCLEFGLLATQREHVCVHVLKKFRAEAPALASGNRRKRRSSEDDHFMEISFFNELGGFCRAFHGRTFAGLFGLLSQLGAP